MEQSPPEQPVERYLAALRDSDDIVRWEAAKTLGDLKCPEAVQPLLELLRNELVNLLDDRDGVWLAALDALQKIGQPAVVPLIALLEDEETDISLRTEAISLLGNIGDKRAVEPLIKILTHRNTGTGKKDRGALGRLVAGIADSDLRSDIEPLLDMLCEENIPRSHAAYALGKIGDSRAVEPLIGVLEDENIGVREDATIALGELGDVRAVEGLIKRLKDEVLEIRGAAAEALGKLGDERALPALLLVLQSQTERLHSGKNVKQSAIRAIESIKNRRGSEVGSARWYDILVLEGVEYGRAVEFFIRSLTDEVGVVRYSAAQALGELGDWRGVEPLINALTDADSDLRWYAAEALGKLGEERALPALVWMQGNDTGDTSWGQKVQEAAARAIARIKGA